MYFSWIFTYPFSHNSFRKFAVSKDKKTLNKEDLVPNELTKNQNSFLTTSVFRTLVRKPP